MILFIRFIDWSFLASIETDNDMDPSRLSWKKQTSFEDTLCKIIIIILKSRHKNMYKFIPIQLQYEYVAHDFHIR